MKADFFTIPPGAYLALREEVARLVVAQKGTISRAEAGAFGGRNGRGAREQQPATVAVVPAVGLIARGVWSWLGTDPDEARASIRFAAAEKTIDGIALLVDSPGGTVPGIEELAHAVRSAASVKPVVSIVAGQAASAAYWVAAAAPRIILTPSAEAGSIGVYATHINLGGALAKQGIEVELIASSQSPHKLEGNPYEPLGDGAREWIQAEVDRIAAGFVASVARGRGVSEASVIRGFGGGRVYGAQEALRRGIADELVPSVEDALAEFADAIRRGDRPALRGATAASTQDWATLSAEERQRRCAAALLAAL